MNEIEANSNGDFVISGELSFTTTSHIYRQGCHLIKATDSPVFDLKRVTSSDNSGPALLAAWTRFAKTLSKTLCFVNLPRQLLAMLKLTNLQQLLPIVINSESEHG